MKFGNELAQNFKRIRVSIVDLHDINSEEIGQGFAGDKVLRKFRRK